MLYWESKTVKQSFPLMDFYQIELALLKSAILTAVNLQECSM